MAKIMHLQKSSSAGWIPQSPALLEVSEEDEFQ
jgi:hypothetical protein